MIRHEGSKWVLYSRNGKRKLGEHPSKDAAEAQEKKLLAMQADRLANMAKELAAAVKARCKTPAGKKPKK